MRIPLLACFEGTLENFTQYVAARYPSYSILSDWLAQRIFLNYVLYDTLAVSQISGLR